MGKIVNFNNLKRLPIVLVCMPFYRSMPLPAIMLHQAIQDTGIPGYQVIVRDLPSTIVVLARNDALQDPPGLKWDYLFFIDDDVGFPLQEMAEKVEVTGPRGKKYMLNKMVALMKQVLDHQLNICGGYYCQRGDQHHPLVFRKYAKDGDETYVPIVEPPLSGVEEVDALATGFLCFSRRVIDAFDDQMDTRKEYLRRYRNWVKNQEEAGELEATRAALPVELRDYLDICKPDIYPPFWLDFIYDPVKGEWRHMGEDVYFCREAQKLGFKMYVDWEVELGHQRESFITPAGYRHAFMAECAATQKAFFEEFEGRDSNSDDTAARLAELGMVPVPAEEEVVDSGQ